MGVSMTSHAVRLERKIHDLANTDELWILLSSVKVSKTVQELLGSTNVYVALTEQRTCNT